MERYFWGRFPIVRASSLFYYAKGGKVAQVLYAMKYHNRRTLCVKMGEWIGSELLPSGFFEGIDFLVPVPLYLYSAPVCAKEGTIRVSFWRGVYP